MKIKHEDIEKVSLAMQIKGKVYFARLDQSKTGAFCSIAGTFCDGGVLSLVKAPEGVEMTSFKDIEE